MVFLAPPESGVRWINEGEHLGTTPNGAECILPQSGTDFDSLAECSIHQDFRVSRQMQGIGVESVAIKGAVHLPHHVS